MLRNIRNVEVNRLAVLLARRTGVSETEAMKIALENELRRLDQERALRERVDLLEKRLNARPATCQEAARDFYDELIVEQTASTICR